MADGFWKCTKCKYATDDDEAAAVHKESGHLMTWENEEESD